MVELVQEPSHDLPILRGNPESPGDLFRRGRSDDVFRHDTTIAEIRNQGKGGAAWLATASISERAQPHPRPAAPAERS
jgi:hypothetical protein